MKRFFLTGFVFAFLFLSLASPARAAGRTEFILDVSGSMNAMIGTEKRIDAARKAMAAAVASIPDGSVVALRLYGHRIPPSDKAGSCKDSQVVVPFGSVNKQQILNLVNQSMPLGQTPIAYSLEQAGLDFGAPSDEPMTIILVSDGEESCGGDPVAAAKALLAKGFKVKIHTIGLDVDAAARSQLEAISAATGGTYKDARDAAALSSSLQQLTQEALLIKKEQAVYGDQIRGGNSYETAAPLQPGKLFRLDHHQRINQFDYFSVDVKPGQKITTFVETGENGVNIQGDQATVNTNPYAGISLHGPTRQQIQKEEIIGARNSRKSISYSIPQGGEGRYYILIGSTYDNQNKDHRFQVDLSGNYDANTQQDAGNMDAAALEIAAGNYEKNYLSGADPIDVFKVNLTPGTYEVKARPIVTLSSGSSLEGQIDLEVYDADGVKLASAGSPNNGAAARIENLAISKPGPVFVRVKDHWQSKAETTYSLSITAAGGAPVVEGAPPATAPGTSPVTVPAVTVPSGAPPSAAAKPSVAPGGDIDILSALKQLTFMQKVKWVGLYCLLPLFVAFLVGLIWGYVWGRRSGKRKALAQAQKK